MESTSQPAGATAFARRTFGYESTRALASSTKVGEGQTAAGPKVGLGVCIVRARLLGRRKASLCSIPRGAKTKARAGSWAVFARCFTGRLRSGLPPPRAGSAPGRELGAFRGRRPATVEKWAALRPANRAVQIGGSTGGGGLIAAFLRVHLRRGSGGYPASRRVGSNLPRYGGADRARV